MAARTLPAVDARIAVSRLVSTRARAAVRSVASMVERMRGPVRATISGEGDDVMAHHEDQQMTREEEQHRDVYARFGAAYARSSAFERNLTNVLLLEARTAGRAPDAADLDRLERELQKKKATLGTLIRAVKGAVALPDLTRRIVDLALDRRNYLAHHFFQENAFEFATQSGCEGMMKQLLEIEAVILAADRKVDEIGMEFAGRLGMTREAIERGAEELRQQLRQSERRQAETLDNDKSSRMV
jgi:hypothetical protein